MARYKEDFLFAEEKKKHPGLVAALILLAIALLGVYVLNLISDSNVMLIRQSVTIPNLEASFKILHISDLHGETFGQNQRRLSLAWRESSYSAVVITGDMIGEDGDTQPLTDLLGQLSASVPILIVP